MKMFTVSNKHKYVYTLHELFISGVYMIFSPREKILSVEQVAIKL